MSKEATQTEPMLRSLIQPRVLLLAMMWVGGLGLVFVFVSAAFDQNRRPGPADAASVLVGEMAEVTVRDLRRPPPDLVLRATDPAVGAVLLSQLVRPGQPTLVNLWASWCAPCLEELPSLAALAAGTDTRVVLVAMEPVSPAIEQTAARAGLAEGSTLWVDADLGALRAYGTALQLPTTILYDAQGREAARLTGAADWNGPDARRLVDALREGRALR